VLCLRSTQVVKKSLSLLELGSKALQTRPQKRLQARSQGTHIYNVRAFRAQFEIAEATCIAVPSYSDSEFEGAHTRQGRRGARGWVNVTETHQSGFASFENICAMSRHGS